MCYIIHGNPCIIDCVFSQKCVDNNNLPMKMHNWDESFFPTHTCRLSKHLILALDALKEGNMANIPPTNKVDISITLGRIENILLRDFFLPWR